MKFKNDIKAASCLLFAFPSILIAQENWGPADYVQIVAGCTYVIVNPCFYDSGHYCYESISFDDDYCKLRYGNLTEPFGTDLIPGDSLNLAGYNYISPFITPNFDRLYFSSDLPGGYGGFDIWMSNWNGSQWSPPENLGSSINSDINESGPSVTESENELYFYRNADPWSPYALFEISGNICKSDYVNGSWEASIELPPPINFNDYSFEPSISADGSKLYFCGYRPEISDHRFAYVTHRVGDNWLEPELLNSNINQLVSAEPWYDDSTGDVYSLSLDNFGTAVLFTHYACYDGYIEGQIRISRLNVGVDELHQKPEDFTIVFYPIPSIRRQ